MADGTVVAWGDNSWGQSTVPAGLSNVVAIAAGARHSLALKQDGTVAAWGDNTYSQLNVPDGMSNVVGIAAGDYHNLAIIGDGSPVITVPPVGQYNPDTGAAAFFVMAAGSAPLSYQWLQDGTNIADATNSVLVLTNLSTTEAGAYSVTVSNSLGTATSPAVKLPPAWRRPFFWLQPQDQTIICNDSVTFQSGAVWFRAVKLPMAVRWNQPSGSHERRADFDQCPGKSSGRIHRRRDQFQRFGDQPGGRPDGDRPTAADHQSGDRRRQTGDGFSYTITGLHNPTVIHGRRLPAGLQVNPTNGVISGTPLVKRASLT